MSITVSRCGPAATAVTISAAGHHSLADMAPPDGAGEGPDPHDLYDAALGACKALTIQWYAKRKGFDPGPISVRIERDNSRERAREGPSEYRLTAHVALDPALDAATRAKLGAVAALCPVHRLMADVKTINETVDGGGASWPVK